MFFLAYGSDGALSPEWIEKQTRTDLAWFRGRLARQLEDEMAAIKKARKK